jgi:hypothetical protein
VSLFDDPLRAALLAAIEILDAEGRADVAALVRDGELVAFGESERWEVGSKHVEARHVALIVEPRAFVALRDPAKLDVVRDAVRAVLRSPATDLAGLTVLVRLPIVGRAFGQAYRSAPERAEPERPSDDRVLAGARELARAMSDADAVGALEEARLESAEVASSADRLLRRYVLRLSPAALARSEKNRAFSDRLRWLVEQAATRAVEAVADVELRLAID